MPRQQVITADITTVVVDAIVNAANRTLRGGGGVDGAIHRAGGPAILAACRSLGGCDTGDAVATIGGALPARWVIHTVGPVWRGGGHDEDALLASCYERSLTVAADRGATSIAFPSISTGVYRFPIARAARIATRAVAAYLVQRACAYELVLHCCFSDEDARVYREALAEI